jgi:hypothetical protein
MSNEMIKKETDELALQNDMPMGFEDEDTSDVIIPRVKVVQTLSPERKDKIAEEGDIINSLTKEKLNGKVFIPVFKFNNNVWWKERSEGGGIKCIARDGRVGSLSDGTTQMCAQCRRCEFDNTKQGKEALPTCTKYINFFGFFAGERMPIILSFSKTCYNEGKKLYSLAKVTMQNMWNYGYTMTEKLMAKGGNEWYVPVMTAAGPTNEADREFALALFKAYRNNMNDVAYDMEEQVSSDMSAPAVDVDATEY